MGEASAHIVGRATELASLGELLAQATTRPAVLVLEGAPGIGKSTLWLSAVQSARSRDFTVLTARGASAETVLAYAALADLLDGVDPGDWSDLPGPQRRALDQVVLRNEGEDVAVDRRAVAAALRSVLERGAAERPVLVAIDDLQWIDTSSLNAIAFVTRRLSGRIGVLCAVRTDTDARIVASVGAPVPYEVQRLAVAPLPPNELRTIVSARLGTQLSRSALAQIHHASAGNPFYALELARTIDGEAVMAAVPESLSELVKARIGNVADGTAPVLLAAASLAAPTVEQLAAATDLTIEGTVVALEDAEAAGIVAIDGVRVSFTHPLLALGVYADARPKQRRDMHRRLATVVDTLEVRARHLALAATSADPATLAALDEAAESARMRGAPAAAAELTDLALRFDDSPQRRIRSAGHHFNAGESGRARRLLEQTISELEPGELRARAASLLSTVLVWDESFTQAALTVEQNIADAAADPRLRVQMLITLAYALVNAGRPDVAIGRADDAVAAARDVEDRRTLSQALGMRAMLGFMLGEGFDEAALTGASEADDGQDGLPLSHQPRVQVPLLRAWTGDLGRARTELAAIRQSCIERGEDGEQVFIDFHCAHVELWTGDLDAAAAIGADALGRAEQLQSGVMEFSALAITAAVAVYRGHAEQARRDTALALAAGERSSSQRLMEWPVANLGFLEVSLGNYPAAVQTLTPLIDGLRGYPYSTEIISGGFIPDAVEALTHLRRLDEAAELTDIILANGARLDRAWMLAVGHRCKAGVLAGRGDVGAAVHAAEAAIDHHSRIPMPFELARTQLLLGQLLRRRREKATAAAAIGEALSTFEGIGMELWVARARAELMRVGGAARGTADLTPTERRVAELAVAGMTNREAAAMLSISPKTVEANLARVYRKLGIHSRAELGHRFGFRGARPDT